MRKSSVRMLNLNVGVIHHFLGDCNQCCLSRKVFGTSFSFSLRNNIWEVMRRVKVGQTPAKHRRWRALQEIEAIIIFAFLTCNKIIRLWKHYYNRSKESFQAQTRFELAIFGLRDRRLTTWPLRLTTIKIFVVSIF